MATRSALAKREGLTEEQIASLALYQESPLFTDRERAALRLADTVIVDRLRPTAELYDEVRRHFNEIELVEIGLTATIMSSLHRLFTAFSIEQG
jgi:alkylhydroperoxidase family enzyme